MDNSVNGKDDKMDSHEYEEEIKGNMGIHVDEEEIKPSDYSPVQRDISSDDYDPSDHIPTSVAAQDQGMMNYYSAGAANRLRTRITADLLKKREKVHGSFESTKGLYGSSPRVGKDLMVQSGSHNAEFAAISSTTPDVGNDSLQFHTSVPRYEVESSDKVSDISSSDIEDEGGDGHDRKMTETEITRDINISGADLICNHSRSSRPVTRTGFETRRAVTSRFSNSGSMHSAYHSHRQPLTSNYGFSATYGDAVSKRSGSSGGHSPQWKNVDVRAEGRRSLSRGPSLGTTSNISPYYEHTGGWLRLRPQNPSNFEYRSNVYSASRHRLSVPKCGSSISSRQSPTHPDHNSTDNGKGDQNPEAPDAKNNDIESPRNETSLMNENQYEGKDLSNEAKIVFHAENLPSPLVGEGGGDSHYDPSAENHPQPPRETRSIGTSVDTQWASPDSKFERYACRVDHSQGDKAVEIPLFLFERPHMRAFHFAWMSFFVAFFTWFAIAPLLPEIRDSLNLSHREIYMSNVFSSAGTVICRIIVGPLCDRYGARWVMATTLIIAGIPVMATGLVNNAAELSVLRLITGIAGSSFVTCQYWTSSMFSREIAGTANSLAAGWGNLGGGITNIVMGSALFPLFKMIYGETAADEEEVVAADRAWRIVCIVPALLSFVTAFFILKYSDDSPKGNYMKMKRLGLMPKVEVISALKEASRSLNTWILFIHYGCCFGVEVTMTAGAALYFSETFKQSTESAAALASIFGWLNLFARGLGGFTSDITNVIGGMRGRLLWHVCTLVLEGVFVLAFAYAQTLGSAITIMVCFSLFVQCAEGSTYSIVPYVCPKVTGSVAGLVGAGGNLGGVVFLILIQELNYRNAFKVMGIAVICSSVLSFFMTFKGHAGFFGGTDATEIREQKESRLRKRRPSALNSDLEEPKKEENAITAPTVNIP